MVLRKTSSGYKVRGCPSSIPGWVLKKKKSHQLICIVYLICNIYCIYLICILYILYIAYICRVKSEWYIKRTSFTRYIGEPTCPMMLQITSSTRMPWFNTRLSPEKKKKKEKRHTSYIFIIYPIYNIYCIYLICTLYILYIVYICRVKSEWYINRTSFTTYIVEPP